MRIRYKGFKGHSGDYDLGTAALVDGENDTGKSSLVAAIHFALTGKIAAMRMGKGDTQDPGRLLKAIDDGGWAEVTIDGTTVRRVLEATAKKARVLTYCDGMEGSDAEAAAARLSSDLLFADFRRLVAAGDKERADILATYLPQPGDGEKRRWILGQMICHMDAALRPQAKRGKKTEPARAGRMTKEQAVEARASLMKIATANGCDAVVNAIIDGTKAMSDRSPEDMVEALRLAANNADDARKSAGKVAEEAAKATGDQEAAKEIPELEAQVNELRAIRAHQESAVQSRASWEKRMDQLNARLAECDGELDGKEAADVDQAEGAVTAADAQVAEVQRARPAVISRDAMQALRDRAKPLQDEITKLQPLAERRAVTARQLEAAEAKLAGLVEPQAPERDLDALRTDREAVLESIARWKAEGVPLLERRDAAKQGLCPLIGETCPSSESLQTFVERATTQLAALKTQIIAARERSEELAAAYTVLQGQIGAYHTAHTKWTRDHADASTAVKTARAAAQEAARAAERLPQLQDELAPITREIELLTVAQHDHEAAFSDWSAELTAANAALADAKAALTEARATAKRIADLASDSLRIHAELLEVAGQEPPAVDGDDPRDLDALEKRLEDAHAAKARLEVLGRLDIDALTNEATLRKAAHAGAAEGLMNCVQAATEPICGKITEALHRMDVAGEFYVDLEARSFGLLEDGKRIDVEVLGGGKAVLFAGAMLAALPRGEAVRVLTLEGAELHPKWMTRLLKGLDLEAFDSTTVATCHGATEIPDAWNHITMGARA